MENELVVRFFGSASKNHSKLPVARALAFDDIS